MVLHPQAVAALARWAAGPKVTDPGFGPAQIAERRRAALLEAAHEQREPVAVVRDVDADGVPCRLFVPETQVGGPILYAHGGGFVFGEIETHDAHARRVANRARRALLLVDYRRPPEHRFPAAHDDTETAARWLATHGPTYGLAAGPLVALGDSAGGSLALVAVLRAPERFSAMILVYPFIDPRLRSDSVATAADHGFTTGEARWFWQTYAGPDRLVDGQISASLLSDPRFCPLEDQGLSSVPRTLIQAAEHDVLLGEAQLLARRIGSAATLTIVPGMTHGFWRHPDEFDAATTTLAEAVAFLDHVT